MNLREKIKFKINPIFLYFLALSWTFRKNPELVTKYYLNFQSRSNKLKKQPLRKGLGGTYDALKTDINFAQWKSKYFQSVPSYL